MMYMRLIILAFILSGIFASCKTIEPSEVKGREGILEFLDSKFGENNYRRIPNRSGTKILFIKTIQRDKLNLNGPLEFVVSNFKNQTIICHEKLENGVVTWKDNDILMITSAEGNPSSGSNSPLVFKYYDTELRKYIDLPGE